MASTEASTLLTLAYDKQQTAGQNMFNWSDFPKLTHDQYNALLDELSGQGLIDFAGYTVRTFVLTTSGYAYASKISD